MTHSEDFYHRCSIKNLAPEGPAELTSIEEQVLFSKVASAMKKRRWKMEWLSIDLANHVLNIEHSSITEDEALDFYEEVFSSIGKEVLEGREE